MNRRRIAVYGAGEIHRTDHLEDRQGARVVRRFLDRLLIEFAKTSKRYFSNTGDAAYTYGERQLHSFLFPSLLKISDVTFSELQIRRKPRGRDYSSGRVDYWVRAWKTIFFIEVKHSFHAALSGKLNEYSKGQWRVVVDQAKSLPLEQVRDETMSWPGENLSIIGLYIVPAYITRKEVDRIRRYEARATDEILIVHDSILRSIGRVRPTWSACWIIPKRMRKQVFSNTIEIDECVNCFAFVRQVQQRKKKSQ